MHSLSTPFISIHKFIFPVHQFNYVSQVDDTACKGIQEPLTDLPRCDSNVSRASPTLSPQYDIKVITSVSFIACTTLTSAATCTTCVTLTTLAISIVFTPLTIQAFNPSNSIGIKIAENNTRRGMICSTSIGNQNDSAKFITAQTMPNGTAKNGSHGAACIDRCIAYSMMQVIGTHNATTPNE